MFARCDAAASPHRAAITVLCLIVCSLGASSAVSAADSDRVLDVNAAEIEEMQQGLREGDVNAYGLLALQEEQVQQLSPMMQEIRATLVKEQSTVEQLQTQIEEARAARDHQRTLELQRRVERARREAETGIVQIQVRFARERGDTELATRLEAELAAMDRERITGQPKARRQPRQ